MSSQIYYGTPRFFFFQAEDGIRDGHVTGVQTCALPISGRAADPGEHRRRRRPRLLPGDLRAGRGPRGGRLLPRSEERRVGKECGSRLTPEYWKTNKSVS